MNFELVSVYDDWWEINYSNLIPMMAMLNILEGIRLHLIDQEDELKKKQERIKIFRDHFTYSLASFE